MKALLIASSEGRALAPLTDDSCPALLPVAGKPAVVHALESIAAAGLGDVCVALSPQAEQLRALLGDGARWGLRLRYISSWPQESVASIADRVVERDGTEDLLIVHAAVIRPPSMVAAVVGAAMPAGAHIAARAGGLWAGVDRISSGARVSAMPTDPETAATWQSSGEPIDCAGPVLPLDSLASYHRANLLVAAGQIGGVIVPGLERRGGVRAGRGSALPPSAVRGTRVFAGGFVQVHPSAEIHDDVVLCDNVIVDREATLTRTVVLPDTYVGEAVDLTDAIVRGGTLIRVDRGAVTTVVDRFLLADISRPPLSRAAGAAISRLAGLALLCVSAPLWPVALLCSLALRLREPWHVVTLVGSRQYADGRPRTFATAEFAVPAPVLRHLPRILAVITGDLRLVGVSPLPPDAERDRESEWEKVRDQVPPGLLGPGQLAATGSTEERYLLEAIYARTRSPWGDVMWLLRGVRALAGPRAWRLAGDHA